MQGDKIFNCLAAINWVSLLSFGPTILGAHSPDEKASISSTKKFWRFFKEILSNIPEKVNQLDISTNSIINSKFELAGILLPIALFP